jgi:hypothetical protein
MFSPVTSLVAGATVALLGGLLLTGVLMTQEPADAPSVGTQASASPIPLASLDPMRPAWVTSTLYYGSTGTRTVRQDVVGGRPVEIIDDADIRIESSDPRVSGTYSQVYANATYPVENADPILVYSGECRIENEGGSWDGTASGLYGFSTDLNMEMCVLVGTGAYEGLSAWFVFDSDGVPPEYATIAIFPDDLPPAPLVTFEELPQ